MPQTNRDFGAEIGISSLNVESNNFWTAQPILVIHSSNDAAPRKEFGCRGQTAEVCVWRVINKKTPQREFPSQNTPLHNFW
jgi:hypothetical protein